MGIIERMGLREIDPDNLPENTELVEFAEVSVPVPGWWKDDLPPVEFVFQGAAGEEYTVVVSATVAERLRKTAEANFVGVQMVLADLLKYAKRKVVE